MSHNCKKCDQCKIDKLPCQPCIQERYQKEYENWSSGDKKLDKLIKFVRPSLVNTLPFLEWIPHEKIEDIRHLGKIGVCSTILMATWVDGYIVRWNHDEKKWHRRGRMTVILKTINHSDNISDDFLAGLEAYFKCASPHLTRYFGITQNPITYDYAIVMEYAENGDLRTYIQNNKDKLYWRRKLDILRNIIAGLEVIHVTGMTHRDLHIGNILQFKDLLYPSRISDFGLSKQAIGEGTVQVSDYIAPEVLNKKPYTNASDIYSFAMILWEVGTGEKPHANLSYNDELALQIKYDQRPEIPKEIPECYANLIKQCWDMDPEKRPTVLEIKEKIMRWQSVLGWFSTEESYRDYETRQFEKSDNEHPPLESQKPSTVDDYFELSNNTDDELTNETDDELSNDTDDELSSETDDGLSNNDGNHELPDGKEILYLALF
ncbi:kinase-like domain-containing protein [Glomus cerebriforme]|uniref:Kinase-like domain-containing protein n=1 Tax=Glomus cerebriforme TaxID=658196 RepID=A0A397S7E4_9GLOM|nr:kinase-like domain-containing protein [Glomus cerebriforme]